MKTIKKSKDYCMGWWQGIEAYKRNNCFHPVLIFKGPRLTYVTCLACNKTWERQVRYKKNVRITTLEEMTK